MTTKTDTTWQVHAACRGVDPEVFFPVAQFGPAYEAQVATAKRVCAGCPVRQPCLAVALVRIPSGVAGGLDEDERRDLLARREPPRAADHGGRRRARRPRRAVTASRAVARGEAPAVVAREFGVCTRTVERWTRAHGQHGPADDQHRGRGTAGGVRP